MNVTYDSDEDETTNVTYDSDEDETTNVTYDSDEDDGVEEDGDEDGCEVETQGSTGGAAAQANIQRRYSDDRKAGCYLGLSTNKPSDEAASGVYIGSTYWKLGMFIRIKEHRRAIKQGSSESKFYRFASRPGVNTRFFLLPGWMAVIVEGILQVYLDVVIPAKYRASFHNPGVTDLITGVRAAIPTLPSLAGHGLTQCSSIVTAATSMDARYLMAVTKIVPGLGVTMR
ncbi:hypothetical protein C8A00DRAFT_37103 [Chaetomidium leptoderma]|uniref:Uncharacterized protein n=1 Tax=Chaetomidium leptoderma TaxID=669021 RepID=A0AAN6VFE2_9PEZI|nr:hypothetical protein C8A00DRAFT_37103 [Chaetomidium leptoderma]